VRWHRAGFRSYWRWKTRPLGRWVPAFEEIEPEIKAEWIESQRLQAKRKAYETMRARYQVVLPENRTSGCRHHRQLSWQFLHPADPT
jgi:hypothetical protein